MLVCEGANDFEFELLPCLAARCGSLTHLQHLQHSLMLTSPTYRCCSMGFESTASHCLHPAAGLRVGLSQTALSCRLRQQGWVRRGLLSLQPGAQIQCLAPRQACWLATCSRGLLSSRGPVSSHSARDASDACRPAARPAFPPSESFRKDRGAQGIQVRSALIPRPEGGPAVPTAPSLAAREGWHRCRCGLAVVLPHARLSAESVMERLSRQH
jgi:hypothetical protein